MEQVFPKAIRKSPKEWLPSSEMLVELKCGSLWRLQGSDRMEVVGAGPCHVTFSEYSLAKPTGWDLIRPMIRENNGTARFITTPRGRNHAYKQWLIARDASLCGDKDWFAETQTIYDTRAFDDPDKVMAEERAAGMPDALIRQEYLCDWNAALVGSVWGDLLEVIEKNGQMEPFDHEHDGVYVTFDLGIGDATALWFWRITDGVDFIDHYEAAGKPMSHFWDVMESKGYKYTKIWLPHDARSRSLQTGVGILDQALARWPGKVAIAPEMSLADGVQAGRWLLQQPKLRFHPRCKDGLEALRQYHYEWDAEKKTLSRAPEHDWSSHSADSFRYTALVAKVTGLMRPAPVKPEPKDYGSPADKSFTLDKLWEIHSESRRGY
jgi:phage terminase large subunit